MPKDPGRRRGHAEMSPEVREQRRAEALAALPAPYELLKSLLDTLDRELPEEGCDRTRRLTERFLQARGFLTESVLKWLDDNHGYCDCEVLANVEERMPEPHEPS